MAVDILAKNQIVGIIEETISGAWGTPATAATQFKRQWYNVGTTLPDFGKADNEFDIVGSFSDMKEQGRRVNDAISGLKKLPFSGYVTKANASDHLMAAFWDLYGTEGAATPYTKIFNCGDSQYDFASGEGVTFSVGVESNHGDTPASISDGLILENAVIDNLTLSLEPNASGKDKYMKMSGEWVGRNMQTEVNFSSTWLDEDGTAYSNNYSPTFFNTGSSSSNWFNLASSELVVGGVNMGGCYRRFEMTINNNISSDCVTTGGKPNNYKRNRTVNFTIDIPYNPTTYQAVESFRAGDLVVLSQFDNGTTFSANGGFQFSHSVNYLTAQPMVFEGDYIAIRLQFEAYRPYGGYLGIVGLSDAIDKGW